MASLLFHNDLFFLRFNQEPSLSPGWLIQGGAYDVGDAGGSHHFYLFRSNIQCTWAFKVLNIFEIIISMFMQHVYFLTACQRHLFAEKGIQTHEVLIFVVHLGYLLRCIKPWYDNYSMGLNFCSGVVDKICLVPKQPQIFLVCRWTVVSSLEKRGFGSTR